MPHQLPAGLLPGDMNIELFAHPKDFGKCLFLKNGEVKPFHELPLNVLPALYRECLQDKRAVKGLKLMGIKEVNWVEQYNYCNRGRLDGITDISTGGKTTIEFVDCERRGHCPGEGLCCKQLSINGERITNRERQCLKLLSQGRTDKEIRREMGFHSQASVNSLMERLRNKTHVNRRSEMAIIAKEAGL